MPAMRALFTGYPSGLNAALHDPAATEIGNTPIARDAIRSPEAQERIERFALSCRFWKDIPAGEQLALMTLRRSEITTAVVEKLRKGTARASQRDYWNVMRAGLAQRHARGFLMLTPQGRRQADAIAVEAARGLGLHFFTTGHNRLHNFVRCCCGWSHYFTAPLARVAACNTEWMGRHILEALGDDGLEDFKNVYGDQPDDGIDGEFEEHAP